MCEGEKENESGKQGHNLVTGIWQLLQLWSVQKFTKEKDMLSEVLSINLLLLT